MLNGLSQTHPFGHWFIFNNRIGAFSLGGRRTFGSASIHLAVNVQGAIGSEVLSRAAHQRKNGIFEERQGEASGRKDGYIYGMPTSFGDRRDGRFGIESSMFGLLAGWPSLGGLSGRIDTAFNDFSLPLLQKQKQRTPIYLISTSSAIQYWNAEVLGPTF
ncbi:hypothetical protein BKA70DRAFT_1235760 [Coprinopsis sp. MPI-PUGE-AT-0042]|nr:hypothetical protein BKA70DRAFT_1235760 [Coprinopsis sp. MPI-PUGE-AT-0042]